MITGIIYICPKCKCQFRFMYMLKEIMSDYKGFHFTCSHCGYKEILVV